MNNNSRRFKRICLTVALAFIPMGTRYIQPNNIKNTKQLVLNSNITDQLPVTTKCLPTERCHDEVKNNVVVPHQKKKIIWNIPPLKKDIHQCKIVFNEESIQKINQIIEQLSYEVVLNKTTHKINNYLQLKIISPKLPDNFNKNLGEKIEILLKIYKQRFGLFLHKKTEINLVILPSNELYNDFMSNLDIDSSNSQGLFWVKSNYAFVAFKNKKQMETTSLHEIVHAVNFSLVGLQSRWLNEGLAELFENMEITKENADYIVNLNIPKSNNDIYPLDYLSLVYSEDQWSTGERKQLYSSSLLFLSYLLTYKNGTKIVSNLLKEESKNPCSKLSADTYLQLIDKNVFNLPSSFDDWFEIAK